MNRLALMILKNIHIVPAGFAKLWHYAANVDNLIYRCMGIYSRDYRVLECR